MAKREIASLVLAAGAGTRMKSALPKVLHTISGYSLVEYIIRMLETAGIRKNVIVVGHGSDVVKRSLKKYRVNFALQREQLGTAHAVQSAKTAFRGFTGDVLVIAGDVPLIETKTIKEFYAYHKQKKAKATVLTTELENPAGYGRIVRSGKKKTVQKIVEELDATSREKKIREINSGIYFFDAKLLFDSISKIKENKKKKEFYLTDLVEHYVKQGISFEGYLLSDPHQIRGINSRFDLVALNKIMNERNIGKHLKAGVTVLSPENTFIDASVQIGSDTTIYPFTYIEKDVRIGKNCSIGPFAKLRSGTKIDDGATVGSFVEVNRTHLKKGTSVKHLAYLGDATVGPRANIGAGTITANFDGEKKSKTVIEEGVHIGSNTVLVAPTKIGKQAKTGAGTVIKAKQHVPPKKTAVGVPARIL